MGLSRRTFLKISGLAAAGSAVGGLVPVKAFGAPAAAGTEGAGEMAMLNDSSRCIGCLSCAIACKKSNELPNIYEYSNATGGDTWTTVIFRQSGDKTGINTKVQCMHCGQPSCAAVCPTGAAHKREDGVVLIDQGVCIGCGYCLMACPYNVPGKSEAAGTARKCTFCEQRLAEGKITACAESCPSEAILYGSFNDLLTRAQQRVEFLKSKGYVRAGIYGREQVGGLKVLYVLQDEPQAAGLPAQPRVATGDYLLKWFTGLAMAGFLVASPIRRMFSEDKGTGSAAGSKGVDKNA